MRIFFTGLLAFSAILALGQPRKFQWNHIPTHGIVFEISANEARKIVKEKADINRLLHHIKDTFEVSKGWTNRPIQGHFLTARIFDNRVQIEYVPVSPFEVYHFKEYNAISFQVVDSTGRIRPDALIKVASAKLRYDTLAQTYRSDSIHLSSTDHLASVTLDGFTLYFKVRKTPAPLEYPGSSSTPGFYSYLITDKSRYRPGDMVRFKSYIVRGSERPIGRKLNIMLHERSMRRQIGVVSEYRTGAFSGEFLLHDSLNLRLDKEYRLSLETDKQVTAASTTFRLEDYELMGDHLNISLQSNHQYSLDSNTLYLEGKDANFLPLVGLRAQVDVLTQTASSPAQPVTTLPDTLLHTIVILDNAGKGRLTIHPSLFKRTDVGYNVSVKLLNAKSQLTQKSLSANYYASKQNIQVRLQNDSLVVELLMRGKPIPIPATLLLNEDTIRTTLPFKTKLKPHFSRMTVLTSIVQRVFDLATLNAGLDVLGGIYGDSLRIELKNPHQVQTTWMIYQGDELIHMDGGTQLSIKKHLSGHAYSVFVDVLYTFAGKDRKQTFRFDNKPDNLQTFIDLPDTIQPGQSSMATITVLNQDGKPVPNVDLTSWAVNARMGYVPPAIPYFGRKSEGRNLAASYSAPKADFSFDLPLRLDVWSSILRLDTMTYYQFAYPGKDGFIKTIPVEGPAQCAVFVMRNGRAEQVYVVEVDHVPVWFSWVTAPAPYVFAVDSKEPNDILLRMYDRTISMRQLQFTDGLKTIISVNADNLPSWAVSSIPLVNSRKTKSKNPSSEESSRYAKYISSFNISNPTWLETSNGFVPVSNPWGSPRSITIVGPLREGRTTYRTEARDSLVYIHKNGYRYSMDGNVVYRTDDKLVPTFYKQEPHSAVNLLNDTLITRSRFKQALMEARPVWKPEELTFKSLTSQLLLMLAVPRSHTSLAAVMFQYGNNEPIVRCGTALKSLSSYDVLKSGEVELTVLYENGEYQSIHNVPIRAHSRTIANLTGLEIYAPTSQSKDWVLKADTKCYQTPRPTLIMKDQRRTSRRFSGGISGTVYSEDGQPLPGVNVVIQHTAEGTVTDVDGTFQLDASLPTTLNFSFIGYKTQTIEVSTQSMIELQMESDVQALNEVVVVGYSVRGVSIMNSASRRVLFDAPEAVEEEVENRSPLLELSSLIELRKNFNDVGYWQPRLFTNKKGKAQFEFTLPDDITSWVATVYAMNRRLQTGTAYQVMRAFKPVMAELDVPRFLTLGDSCAVTSTVRAIDSTRRSTGNLNWIIHADTLRVPVEITSMSQHSQFVRAYSTDSIAVTAALTSQGRYVDGETRMIPVNPKGTIRMKGNTRILQPGDSLKVVADSVNQVEVFSRSGQLFARVAEDLVHYKYECNEQLASKLVGLLSQRLTFHRVGAPFKNDVTVKKIIVRLIANQNHDMLWSWWNKSDNTSIWVSTHVLRALQAARKEGYEVNIDIAQLSDRVAYLLEARPNLSVEEADLISAMAEWRAPLHYSKYLYRFDTTMKRNVQLRNSVSLKERLLIQEIRQLIGKTVNYDSLYSTAEKGILGERFFTDPHSDYGWNNDGITLNAVAYRILSRSSISRDSLQMMQLYYLTGRTSKEWNTLQSASALLSVYLLNPGWSTAGTGQLLIDGKEKHSFGHEQDVLKIAHGSHTLLNQTSLPLFVMTMQSEVVTTPSGSGDFSLSTHFEGGQQLSAGKPVRMTTTIGVLRDAASEYVMIEIPVPASCSYVTKLSGEVIQEVHREYFRDKVVIFCNSLKKGSYTFTVELLPRFTGKFFLNPAQVSLMYIPVIHQTTGMANVTVK